MSTEIKAQPEKLVEMTDYQKDSVISRTLVKKDSGTVTLFAFDEGQALSEHTAPFDAIAQILDGESEIKIGESVYNVKAGEMVLMPANIPHALKANEKFKMLLTMLKA